MRGSKCLQAGKEKAGDLDCELEEKRQAQYRQEVAQAFEDGEVYASLIIGENPATLFMNVSSVMEWLNSARYSSRLPLFMKGKCAWARSEIGVNFYAGVKAGLEEAQKRLRLPSPSRIDAVSFPVSPRG